MLLKNIMKLSLILIFLAFISMNYSCTAAKTSQGSAMSLRK